MKINVLNYKTIQILQIIDFKFKFLNVAFIVIYINNLIINISFLVKNPFCNI